MLHPSTAHCSCHALQNRQACHHRRTHLAWKTPSGTGDMTIFTPLRRSVNNCRTHSAGRTHLQDAFAMNILRGQQDVQVWPAICAELERCQRHPAHHLLSSTARGKRVQYLKSHSSLLSTLATKRIYQLQQYRCHH